jgi:hypothetical protein
MNSLELRVTRLPTMERRLVYEVPLRNSNCLSELTPP